MNVSYRWTAIPVLLAFACSAVVHLLMQSAALTDDLNPCFMWEQMSAMSRLSVLIWFASFSVLVVQGLRNRPVPWWVAAVSLISFGGVLKYEGWRWVACNTTRPEKIAALGRAGTVILMSVHQLIGRSDFLSHRTSKNIFGA
jgi:hypothetical protein